MTPRSPFTRILLILLAMLLGGCATTSKKSHQAGTVHSSGASIYHVGFHEMSEVTDYQYTGKRLAWNTTYQVIPPDDTRQLLEVADQLKLEFRECRHAGNDCYVFGEIRGVPSFEDPNRSRREMSLDTLIRAAFHYALVGAYTNTGQVPEDAPAEWYARFTVVYEETVTGTPPSYAPQK